MMNEAERTLLTQWVNEAHTFVTLSGTLKWTVFWCLVLMVCGLVVVATSTLAINPIVAGVIGGSLVILAIVCLIAILSLWSSYVHWSGVFRRFQRHDGPEIQRALEDGFVTVKRVAAQAVIEIVEYEDEGGGYIFDLGDNQVLFLKGQHYFPVIEDMVWPNSDFEIVRTQIGARWVGIFCHGEKLLPVRRIETSDLNHEIAWEEHEEVANTDLDSFVSRLLTR